MSEEFARRYKLRKRIAIGGTAEVFHADFIADGVVQPVVVKRVLPQFARDERFRRLFQEEACVAATVSHPNIVRVLDHGQLEQTCYIALERVDGRDLGTLLAQARATDRLPPPQMAAFVAARVAEALQFIHEKTSSEGTPLKIIHRDVSPQNILVSFQGDVKLTDFGIAKSIIRQETTVDGTLRGKLDYMAPEQASLTEVDHRADLFALGCVLFEMIQGAPPFRGDNELETLDRIRNNRITTEVADLPAPEPLKEILQRALRPEREERYQQAVQMVTDLRDFMNRQAEPPSAVELGRWITALTATQTSTRSSDVVDHAVQQLLGQSIEPAATQDPSRSTAVFARSATDARQREKQTAEVRAPASRPGRWLPMVMVMVVILGLSGWLLWAVRYFGTDEQARVAADSGQDTGAARRDASGAPADLAVAPSHPSVWVRSTPGRATVLLDGRPLGKTPYQLRLPDAPFVLELQLAGHRTWRRHLEPSGLHQPIRAVLQPATVHRRGTGLLTINSMPWSRVTIDGTYVGNTPLIKMQLPAGKHRVVLLDPKGAVRKSFTVNLPRGEGRSYTFDFTR